MSEDILIHNSVLNVSRTEAEKNIKLAEGSEADNLITIKQQIMQR
jgi:hypothetical protein